MFLVIDNERAANTQVAGESPLIDILRELRCDYVVRRAEDVLEPDSFDQFAAVLLSDGELAPGEAISPARFRLDFQALLHATVPVLGIGTGARILAEADGVTVRERAGFEPREVTAELNNQSVLFDFLGDSMRLRDERAAVPDHIPAHFEVVATAGEHGIALQHRSRERYAIWFSIGAAPAAAQVVRNFIRYAGTAAGAL